MKGEITLAAYLVSPIDTVRYIVFDIDISKRKILTSTHSKMTKYKKRAHEDIMRIKKVCTELGGHLYIVDSGYKGRHGWLFFDKAVPAPEAIVLGERVLRLSGGPSSPMVWELYPRGKSERAKNLIKLPLGINQKSRQWCLFLNDLGEPFEDQASYLKGIKESSWEGMTRNLEKMSGESFDTRKSETEEGSLPLGLTNMIKHCKILRHLIEKARNTYYLTHFERVCLLYTLTFAGEDGCNYLHRVIGYCLNYDRQYTQKQIDKRKGNPISCAKIMELFPELAQSLPCNCQFNIPPRGYPSPVLYILESEIGNIHYEAPFVGNKENLKEKKKTSSDKKRDASGPEREADYGVVLDFENIFREEGRDSCKVLPDAPSKGDVKDNEFAIERLGEKGDKGSTVDTYKTTDVDVAVKEQVAELAQEYTRLKAQLQKVTGRLESVASQLDKIFKESGLSTIKTPIGEIGWELGKNERKRLTISS